MKNPSKKDIEKVDLKLPLSPAFLDCHEKPVRLIRCSTGYWIMDSEDNYILDDKKNMRVISRAEAIKARAKYEINFQEEILETKIQDEVKILIEKTKKESETIIRKMKMVLMLSGKMTADVLCSLQKRIWEENQSLEQRIAEAKEVSKNESFQECYDSLKEMYEKEDFNGLYILLFQDGLPQITSFEHASKVFVEHFHKDKIQDTINEIQSKDHIYNVAKFNILKTINNE